MFLCNEYLINLFKKILLEYCKDTNPCLNGGTCTTNDELYECTCVYGYGGPNCEIGLNFLFILKTKTF